MTHYLSTILICCMLIYSCNAQKDQSYPQQVGDIAFDATLDDPNFKPCNEDWMFQYYNFGGGVQFEGEKIRIKQYYAENFKTHENFDGYITIRFVVNCEGETGRFRIEQMDFNYQPTTFAASVSNQLLTLTKKLSGWKVQMYDNKPRDYNQYLTFKFESGQLKEILP